MSDRRGDSGAKATEDRGPSLPDPLRHLAAGLAAAAAYLILFFSLSLVLWAAIAGALTVYAATLLLVRRRPPPAERMLAEDVSEADLNIAVAALIKASDAIEALEDRDPPARDRGIFRRMAAALRRIARHHQQDPRDLRHTRRFLRHDLPRMVETAEAYVDLAGRAGGAEAARLSDLSKRIHGFAPVLDRIERACLENDFMRLEVEAEVLSEQLARR